MEREDPARIDDLWHAARPAQWSNGKHAAERRMLQAILVKDEVIQTMTDCTFSVPVAPLKRRLKLWGYDHDRGVAIVTDRRVLFLKHKAVGGDIAVELPFKALTGIAETGGGDLAEGVHVVREKDAAWRIARVSPESSQVNFTEAVREHAKLTTP